MRILGEIRDETNSILFFKAFISNAPARKESFRIHHHAECELSLVLHGNGLYSAKKEYSICSGDLFYYKSGEQHCITNISDDGMSLLNFHISTQFFRILLNPTDRNDKFGIKFLQRCFSENRLQDFLSVSDTNKIKEYMLDIKTELEEKNEGYLFMTQSKLSAILVILSRNSLALLNQRHENNANAEAIFIVTAYIDENYGDDISLYSLSEKAHLESTYFSALFKKHIGVSPWVYLCVKRTEKAIELLKTTDKSILNIATQCGFNNTANFNRIFKKYTGQTPRMIRKTIFK